MSEQMTPKDLEHIEVALNQFYDKREANPFLVDRMRLQDYVTAADVRSLVAALRQAWGVCREVREYIDTWGQQDPDRGNRQQDILDILNASGGEPGGGG